jgi:DNA-binding NarL/FixJ family response regulator
MALRLSPLPYDYKLTAREKEILSGLVQGNRYQMIVSACHISLDTGRAHIRKGYKKRLHSQTKAVVKAPKERLV